MNIGFASLPDDGPVTVLLQAVFCLQTKQFMQPRMFVRSVSTSNGPTAGESLKGHIHEKKPVKLQLEAGKLYSFCTCGYSKKQVKYCNSLC